MLFRNMAKQQISRAEIDALDKRFRVKLINSLPGCKSLNLIGTVNSKQQSNLAIVSTVTHLGSNPPLLGYISRPDSVERHTLSNILETGHYTFNQVNRDIFTEAHQTSARYASEDSEFDAVGLTPEWIESSPAPIVKEANVVTHLKLVETVDLTVNNTVLVIGEVMNVFLQDNLLEDDGNIDLESAGTVAGSGLDGYFNLQKLARLSYAKPDRQTTVI